MERLQTFLRELRRRRVVRAVMAWGIFGFAVLQIFEPIMHGLHLPEWTLSLLVLLLGLGFPATVLLSWIFDLGAGGLERTAPAEEWAAHRGRRVLLALVAMGLLAAAPGLAWYFGWRKSVPAAPASPADVAAASPATAPASEPYVAVLPLRNLSGDPSQEYFSDGMTEEITSKLSRIRGLRLASRTSAAHYKGSSRTAREIGAELGAEFLIEGSVRRAGNRVRITASLVRAADAVQIWSEDLDAQVDDLFAVQEAVATRVVDALGVKLTPREASVLSEWGTRNVAAYDEYLKGRALYTDGRDSLPALQKAIAHLDRALAIDADFAPALAALARAECNYYRTFESDERRLARAEALTARAMALDPRLPTIIEAAADVRGMRFDYHGAAALYRKALEELPREYTLWDQLCWALAYATPPELAEAEAACQRALELQPTFFSAHYHLMRVHVLQRRPELAAQDFSRLERLAPDGGLMPSARFWLSAGRRRWREALQALEGQRTMNLDDAWRAIAYAQLGQADAAFESLDAALRGGYRDAADLRHAEWYAPLRADPRWAPLLARHGIQP